VRDQTPNFGGKNILQAEHVIFDAGRKK